MGAIWVFVLLQNDIALFARVAVLVKLIGFFGGRQRRLYSEYRAEAPERAGIEARQKGRTARSGLSKETSETFFTNLRRLMQDEAI
jgi:hypothetical protein